LAQTPQPGVTRGGSVYRCSTELADQCEAIPFDVTGTVIPLPYTKLIHYFHNEQISDSDLSILMGFGFVFFIFKS